MTLISYARRREVGGTIVYPIILAMVIVSATARILKMVSPRFDNMVAHEAHLKVVFLQIGISLHPNSSGIDLTLILG